MLPTGRYILVAVLMYFPPDAADTRCPTLSESFQMKRVLDRRPRRRALSPSAKTGIFFAALAVLTVLVAWLAPQTTLRHVQVAMLSGATTGNYFATVDRIATQVARRNGRVQNLSSTGSVENVRRLIDGAKHCDVHFALVQNGITYPYGHELEVIGRLPRPESLVILGRNVKRIRAAADLKGLRMGIGPVGSGTEEMMGRVLVLLAGLDLVISRQPIDQQLDMLEHDELDLAAMVISDDARLLADAVTRRKLDILELPDVASLARHIPFARVGVIEAGQMDYVRKMPSVDKKVLQVDALIISNGCARDGVTQGFLTAVATVFPEFVSHNKGQPNLTGLPMAPVAANFFSAEGPDVLGKYAPWAVDIMPLPTWIQLGVAFSVLFSGMALWHRFHLWRIDANRVKIEREIGALFGLDAPIAAIEIMAEIPLQATHLAADASAQIDDLVVRLSVLSARCRELSLSILVPMGEEMGYRYQEMLIAALLRTLRLQKERLGGT
jgi:TRAP-type uncharacterized transport system substrate-binding protein